MGRRRRCGPYGVGDDEDAPPAHITARSRALDEQLKRLEGDARIRAAALVAETFNLDPVALLAEPHPFRRLIRIAAHNVVQNEAEKASKAAERRRSTH